MIFSKKNMNKILLKNVYIKKYFTISNSELYKFVKKFVVIILKKLLIKRNKKIIPLKNYYSK